MNVGYKKRKTIENILGIITLISIIGAAIIGFTRNLVDISPMVLKLVEGSTSYKQLDFELYATFNDRSEKPTAYVTVKSYNGFGGPLKMAVAIDTLGNVLNMFIAEHKETPTWYKRIISSDLMLKLKGKSYLDSFSIGDDVDGLTGATYTASAIVESVKTAALDIAVNQLKLEKPLTKKASIKFGVLEVTLILLLLIGTFGIKGASKQSKKRLRWFTMLTGLITIGFIYNHPLTLVDVNKLLMGYFPDIHNQLYWYLLIFGVGLILLTTNKNIYCQYVCPFGAAQECIALISKAKDKEPNQLKDVTKWFRRIFVWVAIILALVFRSPGYSSYEVYSTLFTLSGTNIAVFFLAIFLVLALFIKRPWCKYLCPIPAIEDILRLFRNIIKGVLINKEKQSEECNNQT